MAKDLDLSNWEKKHTPSLKHKARKNNQKQKQEQEQSYSKTLDLIPRKLRTTYENIMSDDEVTDVISPKKTSGKFFLFIFKLLFLGIPVFMLVTAVKLFLETESLMLIPFLLFISFFIFFISLSIRTARPSFYILGRKSFYHPDLMERPILYSEIKEVFLVTVHMAAGKKDKAYKYNLFCFSFHDEVHEDIAKKAKSFRHKKYLHEALTSPHNLAVLGSYFDADEVVGKITKRL